MDCAALIYSGDDSTHKKKGASSLSPFSSSVLPLGAKHGICGGDYDLERATKMIHDSYNFFSAPSIMTIASSSSTTTSTTKDDYSDNRDSTIYDFEILHHSTSPRNQDKEQQPNYYITTKEEIIQDSLLRGHAHNLLVRATLILSVAKPPKKGKVTKPDSILLSRCESLLQSVQNANLFASASCDGSNEDNNESNQGKKKEKKEEQMIQLNMWNSMIGLCRIIAVLTIGEEDVKNNGDSNSNNATDAKTATVSFNTLADRETKAASLLSIITEEINDAQKTFSHFSSSPSIVGEESDTAEVVCKLLSDRLVSLYLLLEIVGKLFVLYGWGKRKRMTREGAGKLADMALTLKSLIVDMRAALSNYPSLLHANQIDVNEGGGGGKGEDDDVDKQTMALLNEIYSNNDTTSSPSSGYSIHDIISSTDYAQSKEGKVMIENVIRNVLLSQRETKERVYPFLNQMVDILELYNVTD